MSAQSALPRRQRVGHGGADVGHRKRLCHDVMDDGVEARGAFALIGKAGHQQDRQIGKIARRRQRQRDPVHHRHLDIGEQQIEGAVFADQDFQRFGAVFGGDDVVAVHGDGARHQRAHGVFIVGDQYARHRRTIFRERDRCGPAHVLPPAISRLLKKRMSILRPSGRRRGQPRLEPGAFAGLQHGCSSTAFQA